jgi:hypothetical protein
MLLVFYRQAGPQRRWWPYRSSRVFPKRRSFSKIVAQNPDESVIPPLSPPQPFVCAETNGGPRPASGWRENMLRGARRRHSAARREITGGMCGRIWTPPDCNRLTGSGATVTISASRCEAAPNREIREADRRADLYHPNLSAISSACPKASFNFTSYPSALNSFKRERATSFTDSTANGRIL